MFLDQIKSQLIRHEALRLKPYRDSVGKLTIGVGRNLDDVGLTEAEAMTLLDNDIRRTESDLSEHLDWWLRLDEARRVVLANMCFNLGITRLLGFRRFLLALQEGEYQQAADEMKNSLWYRQVKGRGVELEKIMRTGEL